MSKKDDLKSVIKEYGESLNKISKEMLEEHEVSIISICCATKLLGKGEFIGGISGATVDTGMNMFEMLYQVMLYFYKKQIAETSERVAAIIITSFFEQLIDENDHFKFDLSDYVNKLAELVSLSQKDDETDDDDDDADDSESDDDEC